MIPDAAAASAASIVAADTAAEDRPDATADSAASSVAADAAASSATIVPAVKQEESVPVPTDQPVAETKGGGPDY